MVSLVCRVCVTVNLAVGWLTASEISAISLAASPLLLVALSVSSTSAAVSSGPEVGAAVVGVELEGVGVGEVPLEGAGVGSDGVLLDGAGVEPLMNGMSSQQSVEGQARFPGHNPPDAWSQPIWHRQQQFDGGQDHVLF